jgi:gliding motility-associated-like protein
VVDVTVNPVDDTPTAAGDIASVDEDDTVNIAPLGNDNFGGDGPSTGTISITTPPTNGTATVNDGGTPNDPTDDTIDYTPNADYNGPDQITYEICDADGDCTTAVVDVTVNPVNDTPTATDDTASVDEDDTVNIAPLGNDNFGGDGPSTGTISITTPPTNGTATVNDGGTPNDPTDDTIDYTPNADYNGPDQITYEICDADGDCTTAVIDVTVNPVDDNPIANNDTSSTNEDVNVIIDITDNDTDSDGTIDDSTLDLDPNTPGQQSVFIVPGEGAFTDNGNGTVTFDPVPGFNNGITTITYTVNDDAGNTSNEAVISVTIPPCPSALDSDGDGLTDCEETTGIDDPSTPDDPTTFPGGPTSDPNDACDPIGINTTDSDGDGLTDCEETTGIDDPSTPDDPTTFPGGPTSDPNDACDPIGINTTDSDGDGLTDCEETTGIDDPSTPDDPTTFPGGPTSDPNDPCSPIGINTTDTDGDGLTDCEETTGIDDPSTPDDPTTFPGGPTSDPNDPCSPIGINTTDSDGDGLTDCEETTGIDDPSTPDDPTTFPGGPTSDPNDACSPIGINTTDTDGDGLTDCEETTGIDDPSTPDDPTTFPGGPTSDPNDPCSPIGINTTDSDGDGLTDCEETTGIDDPSTPDDPTTFPGGPTSDPNDPCSPIGINTTDTDGDGLTDCEETTGIDDPSTPDDPTTFPGGPTSDPNDPCSPIGINTTDTDGDGLTDCEETTGIDDPSTPDDPTTFPGGPTSDPNDACSPIGINTTDSDGDGLTDCEETTGIDDPSTPDDPTTFPGGPTSDPNDPCSPIGINTTDTDGDGLTDCEETTGIDDPGTPSIPTGTSDSSDPCDPIITGCEASIVVTKVADVRGTSLGDRIDYTIEVENTGDFDLTGISLVDTFTDANGNIISLTEGPSFVSSTLGSDDGILLVGEIATYSASFTITQAAINAGGVSNSVVASGSNPRSGAVSDTSDDGDDLDGNTSDDPTFTELGCLLIFNEFSPNGDGVNDTLIINCIENFPNNKLEVYNRWGNLVYEKRSYNNDWDGTSNGRVTVNANEKLPPGTYYYVLDFGDGSKPKVGWLYINR